jgi:hypothetical protein
MNDEVRKRPSTHKSATGHIPRVDQATGKGVAPPQPPTLPEFPDSDGTTGFMPITSLEGADATKDADDSATRSQQGGEQSTKKR